VQVDVGDLLIVRFAPIRAEKLVEQAKDEARDREERGLPIVFSVSTFAREREDERASVEDLIYRICSEAIPTGRNIYLTTKTILEGQGFSVQPSEPPKLHHDVILGERLYEPDANRLEELFRRERRRNPHAE
jgi:hypothetical protein